MELFSSNIQKILEFSQKKSFLIFSQRKDFPRKFLILQEMKTQKKFIMFREKGAPKKLFIF